ncbi:hypothetical protein ACOSQ2_031593 [Xanthoceras sorbifolium]
MGSLNIKKSPRGKRVAETPLLALPKKTKPAASNKRAQVLLLEDSACKPSSSVDVVEGARGKGKGIDFDASAEQLVQRGVHGHSIMAGSTVYPSSGRGLGAVAQEYLKRASMLYKEFLTRGLSQRIEEEEGPDFHHTLIRHALLAYIKSKEDEEQRCKRFMAGLNLRIKIHLSPAPNVTAITQGRPDNKRSGLSSSQSGFSQTSRKKSKTKWIGGKGTYRGAAFSQSTFPDCSICKKRHLGECKVNTTTCFHCGQEGHFIKECPQLVTTKGSEVGTGTVAPTPSTSGPK